MQLDQFPVRQFVPRYYANINAMTPVPVPMSRMLNGLFCYIQAPNNTVSSNFHGTTTLFKRELFELEFGHIYESED
jgi:hypothetical protein